MNYILGATVYNFCIVYVPYELHRYQVWSMQYAFVQVRGRVA